MIIGFWVIALICLIVIMGEVKYRHFDKKGLGRGDRIFGQKWTESVDVDMDELSMEYIDHDFVHAQTLAMRGSWRLAQNQVMGLKTFSQLKQEEYSKKM